MTELRRITAVGPIRRRQRCRLIAAVVAGLTLGAATSALQAQATGGGRATAPTDYYFSVLGSLYDGDYPYALKEFQACLRSAVKNGTNFWIDSICYHTMCGESYYQMGQYAPALDHYNKALQLFVSFNDWLIPMKFSPVVTPSARTFRPVPWGRPQRQMVLGSFPDTVLIRQGQIDQSAVVARGGVVQQATEFPLNPQEIVRCTCLAIRRRRDLLGPTAPYDALNNQAVTVLTKRPVQPNHWTESWIDVELGCAFAAAGKDAQAKPILEKAILVGGQFDHPLTCIALVELGRIALNAGDYDTATKYFAEAGYSAYYFYDPIIVEESLRYAAITHFLANRPGPFTAVVPAAEWARKDDLRQLQAQMLALAAESQCLVDQPKAAAALLDNARVVTKGSSLMQGRAGAQLNFISGMTQYQLGNVQAGDAATNAALAFAKTGSLKMFHLALTEQMAINRTLTNRMTKEIFAVLLRDPLPSDWLYDPLETLAPLAYHHPLYFERWFEAALETKDLDGKRALEIADLAKRHKFLATQELGGRLLNLRWLLEAPIEALPADVALQRQTILTQFPGYEQLSQHARDLRNQLAALSLTTTDSTQAKQQAGLLVELQQTCDRQEVMLKAMALRRLPAELVFPPRRTAEETQKLLPHNHALLTFYVGSRSAWGFLMTDDRFGYWPITTSTPAALKALTSVLQGFGNYEENKKLTPNDLANEAWRQPARSLFDLLVKESKADLPYGFEELVIVPDGWLWYVPFEGLLASPQGADPQPLLNLIRVRYAPTLGLAGGDRRPRLDKGKTLVTVGKLYPTDDEETARHAFEEFARAVPLAEELPVKSKPPVAPAVYASLADRLIAYADIQPPQNGYYQWNPLTGDRNTPGSALGDWLRLPWHGPEQVAYPGFHTAAERHLQKLSPDEAGYELFLSTTGLMAGGARTVLISRWRTGGRTAFDLTREFMQELPYDSAAKAWRRSVFVAQQSPISPELEPRVLLDTDVAAPAPVHPFFWAGYLVVDTGTEPQGLAADAAGDVLNVVPKQ